MKLYLHNNVISDEVRSNSNAYNSDYINKYNFLSSDFISVEQLDVKELDKDGSSPFMLVWLENINRLFEMIPENINIKNYTFVDLGCGSGISTIYVAENYELSRYLGIDFSKGLIDSALTNKKIIQNSLNCKWNLNFYIGNAKEFISPDCACILFLFNPFDWTVLKKYIENNLESLRRNNSIILYANDLCINELANYGDVIARNDRYNLSVVTF